MEEKQGYADQINQYLHHWVSDDPNLSFSSNPNNTLPHVNIGFLDNNHTKVWDKNAFSKIDIRGDDPGNDCGFRKQGTFIDLARQTTHSSSQYTDKPPRVPAKEKVTIEDFLKVQLDKRDPEKNHSSKNKKSRKKHKDKNRKLNDTLEFSRLNIAEDQLEELKKMSTSNFDNSSF